MHIQSLKRKIWKRDNYTCLYCGLDMSQKYCDWKVNKTIKRKHALITIDHIIPRSKGGDWTEENLVTCCYKCNQKKADHEIKLSVPTRSKTIVFRLLGVLVMWGKWAEKRRARNSPYFRKSF